MQWMVTQIEQELNDLNRDKELNTCSGAIYGGILWAVWKLRTYFFVAKGL